MKTVSRLVLPLAILLITVGLLCYPQAAYQGALKGLDTWVTSLLPALLPFMIFADLMVEVGLVRFLGVLLEPVMRPLFKLPGEAGFAVALGFTSGFPMGAILTTTLYEQQACTQEEAARLVAFTNNASPLFLLITVPITMLELPQLGLLLLTAHYLANLCLGLLLGLKASRKPQPTTKGSQQPSALQCLLQERQRNQLPLGSMLRNAIHKGIQNIVMIGGFVVFFSVLLSLLEQCGLLALLQQLLAALLTACQLSPQLAQGISAGFFEMTLGAAYTADSQAPLLQKLMLISFVLGWSGLSIQAQVNSIIAPFQIPGRTYCWCRPLQGLFAALLIPLLLTLFPQILSVSTSETILYTQPTLTIFLLLPLALLALLLLAALMISSLQTLCRKWHR